MLMQRLQGHLSTPLAEKSKRDSLCWIARAQATRPMRYLVSLSAPAHELPVELVGVELRFLSSRQLSCD